MNYFKLALLIVSFSSLASCGGAEERKAVYMEKAKLSLEAGDLDKARVELKNVLQIDPKDARAYFQLGEIFESQNIYRNAFNNYTRASDLYPDNSEYLAKVGTFYLVLFGDVNKATEIMEKILKKDNNDVNGLLLKAGIFLKRGNPDVARKITQEIYIKSPDNIDNVLFLSNLYKRDDNLTEAIRLLGILYEKEPSNLRITREFSNALLENKEYDRIENIFKELLAKEPEIFNSYLRLASFYQEINEPDKAEKILKDAVVANPKDTQRQIAYVKIIKQNKGNDEAVSVLSDLITQYPKKGVFRLAIAEIYMQDKDYKNAEKIYKTAINHFSDEDVGINSRLQLASIKIKNQDIASAEALVDEALEIVPGDSNVNYLKAKIALIKEDYQQAKISLRIFVKDNPENIDASLLLSKTHRSIGEEGQANEILSRIFDNNRYNLKAMIKLAQHHALNGNIPDLEKAINACLSIDANNYEALSLKSKLLNKQKMFSEAAPYVLKMIELYPDKSEGYVQSVPMMLADNKVTEAISLLEDGYKKVEQNKQILLLLTSLYASVKNFDMAISMVQSAIVKNGEAPELYMLLAKIQILSNKIDSARESLFKIKKIKSEWNELYLLLADTHTFKNENKKAIDILQEGLEKTHGDLKLVFRLTKLYEDLGNFNEAINEYEKAYKNYPDHVVIINNLALLMSEHRNDEKSLKRAKELAGKLKNVDQVLIQDTVGWVYYKNGEYAEAVSILKNVVEKSPDVAVFNYHLGTALYKAGDAAAAKSYLTMSLANNSAFPGKVDAETLLNSIK